MLTIHGPNSVIVTVQRALCIPQGILLSIWQNTTKKWAVLLQALIKGRDTNNKGGLGMNLNFKKVFCMVFGMSCILFVLASAQTWLYMPWREKYTNKSETASAECPFCSTNMHHNELLLHETEHFYVKLNAFPYSKGHCLIIPHKHITYLHELSVPARHELMELISYTGEKVQATFNCQGVNIGANIGLCSGASIPDHLHVHVVPRYHNEKSFLDTVANTTAVPWDLQEMKALLKPSFDGLKADR